MEREGSTLEEVPGAGMLKQDFGRGSTRTKESTGKENAEEKREYMEGKGRGIWGSTLEERPRAGKLGMLIRILEREVWDKTGSTGN